MNTSGAGRGRRGNPCKHNAGPAPRLQLRLLQRARWQHHPPVRLIFPLGECRATRVWFLDIPGNDCGRRGHSYKNNAGPAPRLRLSLLHRARWQHSGSGTRGVGYLKAGFSFSTVHCCTGLCLICSTIDSACRFGCPHLDSASAVCNRAPALCTIVKLNSDKSIAYPAASCFSFPCLRSALLDSSDQ